MWEIKIKVGNVVTRKKENFMITDTQKNGRVKQKHNHHHHFNTDNKPS